ncbi:MAG: hypothetical protein L3J34_06895 [Flavobacteriaceae bacterium]|nr:hypothetical protein [Flavobacteriaceae bacterium]
MKKLILVVTILLFSINVKAQITKGNWMLGGNGSFSYTDRKSDISNPDPSWNIVVNPNIGYFVIDKLAVGSYTSTSFGKYSNGFILSLGPFLRYYFLKPDKKINFFTEVSFEYSINFIKNNENPSNYGYNIKPGLIYFLNSSVALEASLRYHYNRAPDVNMINNGLIFGIGLQIHFERKKSSKK